MLEHNHLAVELRISVAKKLCSLLPKSLPVTAMFIGGSVAKGWADDYSDLELCLVWQQLPNASLRASILDAWQAKKQRLASSTESEIFEDGCFVDGLQVDLWHCSYQSIDSLIDSAMLDCKLTISQQQTLATLEHAIVLKPSAKLEQWQSRLRFTEQLQHKLITDNFSAFVYANLDLSVNRGDLVILYNLISGIHKRLINVLFALNKRFHLGHKNAEQVLNILPFKPNNCWQKIQCSYQLPPDKALQALKDLVEEMFDLVEYQLDLDLGQLRQAWRESKRKKF
ncbi:hypothetical protein [Pelagibaculum spongiae]|uniref:Polymerase nucleotidyl transferase domain-containing protein n=1 Tax=Pelagibaculum spongiae TaxID=2080658 RepID=A0A2V1H6P4_9GAMM|nr:hypothetical protein [Pelagibaculum spongiae]PVZ72102.1 hypothetical protein DC094_03545 [Pelagibaculum spongiae]